MTRAFLVVLAALALAAPAAAFTPNDPLVAKQWYLQADNAFTAWPDSMPQLTQVKVAVIDSGIDAGHPDLASRIYASKSFVGGSVVDREGHGTFVAGLIAAATDNGIGIAGIAFPAQLIVAKVVAGDGTIEPAIESKAIRWAVSQGARVINLSLGGLRDPADPNRDTYSPLEQAAIELAYKHGAVVVAAVGNGDDAPRSPWGFASYPAALPHVIGVGALDQSGAVPGFSNRDKIYVDLTAPGLAVLSTMPRSLTADHPTCPDQGYSDCGPADYQHAEGTSFAAPQVSAAAALLIAQRPDLGPDQVAAILERSSTDLIPANGCRLCSVGRDAYSGWGRLDIAAAVAALGSPAPPADHYEPNDNAGSGAATLYGRNRVIDATVDFWDDPTDVYRVFLRAGERLSASLRGPAGTNTNLVLWKPGTTSVDSLRGVSRQRATFSAGIGPNEHLNYRSRSRGWFYVEVKTSSPGAGAYRLKLTKSR
jgi:subtilisin family serine protease